MLDISPKNLQLCASDAPENLIFFPVDVLKKGLNRRPVVRAAVVAELFVRYYLSGNSCLATLIKGQLSHDEFVSFANRLPFDNHDTCSNKIFVEELWSSEDEFSRLCQDAVRYRFQNLLQSDGMIPVVLKGKDNNSDLEGSYALLLPFILDEACETHGVVDIHGKELLNQDGVPEWSENLKKLKIPVTVRVLCNSSIGLPFEGDSTMLSVQMAWWRKQGGTEGLLSYEPFSIIATGAFDENDRLKPVAVAEKAKAINNNLFKATFIYPRTNETIPEHLKCLPLTQNMPKEKVLEHIRDYVEQNTRWPEEYALFRLKDLAFEVRAWNISNWQNMIKKIENGGGLNKYKHPREHLLYLMFLSEAYCHFGHTKEAKQYNEKACRFAAKHGEAFSLLLLRLEIEQLVLHQDEEDLDNVIKLASSLENQLVKVNDNDLWMRFHGTMAQAHAYGSLAGIPFFSCEKAFTHVDKAIEYAVKNKVESDIAQDMNYKHLLYALFEPGTEDEHIAFQDALNQIKDLKDHHDKAYEKNLRFLMRFQAFAWYRQLLYDGKPPRFEKTYDLKFIIADEYHADWLRCTICKYIGALEAANGNLDEARALFEKAFVSINDNENDAILILIKLTAYAEAYRSLRDEQYLNKAKLLLPKISPIVCQYSLPAWKAYIDNPNNDFPGLSYWY